MFFAAPTPYSAIRNKKKVWSRPFILVEALECPCTNKQYPTLGKYIRIYTYASDERLYCLPLCNEIFQISTKG